MKIDQIKDVIKEWNLAAHEEGAKTRSPVYYHRALAFQEVLDLLKHLEPETEALEALGLAEGFISGFEGDDTQEGIDWLLQTIRGPLGEHRKEANPVEIPLSPGNGEEK